MHRLKTVFFPLFFAIVALASCSFVLAEESLTITTYYPSPYGVYNEMRLFPHSVPITSCDSTTEGTMFYNLTAHAIQVCNGVGGWGGSSGFWAGSGNNVYNTNSGNVGIGTATPTGHLTVYGGAEMKLECDIDPNNYADIHFDNTNAGGREYVIGNYGPAVGFSTPNSFFIRDNAGGDRLMILPNGNVGIGTVTPKGALDVNGTLYFAGGGGQDYENFPSIGVESSDEAFFLPTYTGGEESDLRLYIEDNWDDRFSIWGNSCNLGDCANLAVSGMQHYFQANGNAYHKGYLGIGTIDPQTLLHVYGASPESEIFIDGTGSAALGMKAMGGGLTSVKRIVNTGEGPFWIEETFPGPPIVRKKFFFAKKNAAGNDLVVGIGDYWTGTLSDSYKLSVKGNLLVEGNIRYTGDILDISDSRLKNIKGAYEYGLNEILKLNTVRYQFKENNALGISSTEEHVGLIAQDLQKVIPEAVSEDSSGYLAIKNELIQWTVINAIKDLEKQVEDLKRQISELKGN